MIRVRHTSISGIQFDDVTAQIVSQHQQLFGKRKNGKFLWYLTQPKIVHKCKFGVEFDCNAHKHSLQIHPFTSDSSSWINSARTNNPCHRSCNRWEVDGHNCWIFGTSKMTHWLPFKINLVVSILNLFNLLSTYLLMSIIHKHIQHRLTVTKLHSMLLQERLNNMLFVHLQFLVSWSNHGPGICFFHYLPFPWSWRFVLKIWQHIFMTVPPPFINASYPPRILWFLQPLNLLFCSLQDNFLNYVWLTGNYHLDLPPWQVMQCPWGTTVSSSCFESLCRNLEVSIECMVNRESSSIDCALPSLQHFFSLFTS